MNNILVATDFSNNAYTALFYATKLFASRSCTFHILNVYNELTPLKGEKLKLFSSKKDIERLQNLSKEQLTSTVHKIVLDNGNPKHQFQTLSIKGILTNVLSKTIDEKQIDLVVMGNKGLTETADIFFGSNTIKSLKHIKKRPLLAVPGELDYSEPKEIAFITDFKKGCAKETIAPLLFLASLTKARIRVMHITENELLNPLQESNRKILELCLKDVKHSFHWIHPFDDKAKVIDTFVEKLHIDLYAMVNHKHHFMEQFTKEPVIKDVSMYSKTPFLILS